MPTSQTFKERYAELNGEQKKAVDTIEGPVMVIAGPGTGKTSILTLRIGNILQKTDVGASAILALTFTESGVSSMRRKLLSIIGAEAYKVNIYTFHGFCNEVIRTYPEEFPRIIGSVAMTDADQVRVMRDIFDKGKLPTIISFGSPYHYLKPALGAIKVLKREGISCDEYADFVKLEQKKFEEIPDLRHEKGAHKGQMKGKYETLRKRLLRSADLALVYGAYEKELTKRKFYDYEDMIVETVESLANKKSFLLEVQEKYQYILADEHQDANGAQNKLLELLSNFHSNPNLFIVGDEKQAIYRFQGASVGNFLHFKKLYPEAVVINLKKNYRSGQKILDAAHSLIGKSIHAKGFEPVALQSNQKEKSPKIKVFAFSDDREEVDFTVGDIEKKIASGTKPGEIAVLFRRNRAGQVLRRIFEKTKIPFTVFAQNNILDNNDVRNLRLLFEATMSQDNDNVLGKALFIDFLNLPFSEVSKLLNRRKDRGLFELLRDTEVFSDFARKLDSWHRLSRNRGLVEAFETIVRESGMLSAIVSSADASDRLEALSGFFDEAKRLEESDKKARLPDFLEYLNVLEEHEVAINKESGDLSLDTVKLMTAHKSKGLEFEYVYIVGANDGVWGNSRKFHDFILPNENDESDETRELDDERRLFYVALTRAKTAVTIAYPQVNQNGKELLPSQFIEEIEADSKEVEIGIVNGLEADKAKDGAGERAAGVFAPRQNFGPSLSDRAYLRSLFLERGLNPTALNAYLTCPWQYFFNNLVRIPSAQNKWLAFGTAAHAALEYFFKNYSQETDITKKEFVDYFENKLSTLPLVEKEYKEILEKGRKALSGYYDEYKNTWPRNLKTEYNIKGIILPVGIGEETVDVLLRGKLDKIEFLSDSEVNVVDYKTGGQKSRNDIEGKTKSSDGNYKRQLVFYKLLLDEYGVQNQHSQKMKMASAEIDFIEPNEKGAYRKEKFIITDEEVAELKETIKKVSKEILEMSFWDENCDDEDCQYCALRKSLPR